MVQKPQPSDGGVYKCNIKNEFGELNANLNLNIEGKQLTRHYDDKHATNKS